MKARTGPSWKGKIKGLLCAFATSVMVLAGATPAMAATTIRTDGMYSDDIPAYDFAVDRFRDLVINEESFSTTGDFDWVAQNESGFNSVYYKGSIPYNSGNTPQKIDGEVILTWKDVVVGKDGSRYDLRLTISDYSALNHRESGTAYNQPSLVARKVGGSAEDIAAWDNGALWTWAQDGNGVSMRITPEVIDPKTGDAVDGKLLWMMDDLDTTDKTIQPHARTNADGTPTNYVEQYRFPNGTLVSDIFANDPTILNSYQDGDELVVWGSEVNDDIYGKAGATAVFNLGKSVEWRGSGCGTEIFGEPKTFTINAAVVGDYPEGGTITREGDTSIFWRGGMKYTAKAAAGYYIKSLTVDGADQTGSPEFTPGQFAYTFTDVTANHDIKVAFDKYPATSLTKAVDKTAANEGDTLTYTIHVSNDDAEASLLSGYVVDDLPEGTTFVSATGDIVKDTKLTSNELIVMLNDMAAGTSGDIQVTVTVNGDAREVLENAATLHMMSMTPVESNKVTTNLLPHLSVTKHADVDSALVGDEITYSIVVRNDGLGSAESYQVVDTLPAGLEFVSADRDGVNADGKTTWTVDVAPKSEETLTLVARVTDEAYDDVENLVVVNDPSGNEVGKSTVTTPLSPVIVLTKSCDQSYVRVGDEVTYKVVVSNEGHATATDYVLSDEPARGITFVDADKTELETPETITLAPGESKEYTVKTVVTEDAGAEVVNAAIVKDATGNEVAKSTVTTPFLPTVEVTKTADRDGVLVGNDIIYTVTLKNSTKVDVEDAIVSEIAGTGLTITSIEDGLREGETWMPDSQTIEGFDLRANTSRTLTVKAEVGEDASQAVDNTVAISKGGLEMGRATNTVPCLPVLSVEKVADVDAAAEGSVITYTITVTNDGAADAVNYSIADALGEGLAAVDEAELAQPITVLAHDKTSVTVHATVTGDARNEVINTVTVMQPAAEGAEPAPYMVADESGEMVPLSDDCTTPLISVLSMTKTTDAKVTHIGDVIDYVVTLTNDGLADANILLSEQPGVGLELDDSFDGSAIITVPAKGTVEVPVKATVTDAALEEVTNVVAVMVPATEEGADPTPYMTTDAEGNMVPLVAECTTPLTSFFNMHKTCDKSEAKVGDELVWTITVENTSARSVTGWHIVDLGGEGLEVNADEADQVVDIPAYGKVTVTVHGKVTSEAGKYVTNVAQLVDNEGNVKVNTACETKIVASPEPASPTQPEKQTPSKQTTSKAETERTDIPKKDTVGLKTGLEGAAAPVAVVCVVAAAAVGTALLVTSRRRKDDK